MLGLSGKGVASGIFLHIHIYMYAPRYSSDLQGRMCRCADKRRTRVSVVGDLAPVIYGIYLLVPDAWLVGWAGLQVGRT